MTLYGTDFSQYNENSQTGKPVPVILLKQQGFSFLSARSSIGTDTDTHYFHFRNRAHYHKIPFNAYHYVKAGILPHQQAVHCKSVVGNIPLFVDCEEGDWSHSLQFIESCRAVKVNVVALYLPHWRWSELGSPDLTGYVTNDLALIASSYGQNINGYASHVYPGDNAPGWNSYGGKTPTILQFGSRIKLDKWSAGVDGDAYKGNVTQLQKSGLFHTWNV
jgi:hypothetical protein